MKNENEIMKIRKIVSGTKVITNGMIIISYIAIAACMVVIAAAVFKPSFNFNIPFPNELLAKYSIDLDAFTRKWAIVLMLTYILYAIFVMLILKPLKRILHTVVNGRPFDQKNCSDMSFVGWIIIIGINLIMILQHFMYVVIMKINNIKGISTAGAVTMISVKVNWGVVLFSLFVGVLILILSQIFKYGSYLQNEYDSVL